MNKPLFLACVFACFICACKTQKPLPIQEETPLEKSLLWKISGEGLEDTSYLFGTIHIIPEEDFFWPKGTLASIGSSEEVIFEVDLDDMNDLGKQMALLPKLVMKDGIGLKDLYSDEEYKIVKEHFAEMGIPFFFLEKLKPMFLVIFASGDLEIGQGFDGGGIRSYEMEIFEIANHSDIEVEGLETIDYQVSVFDSIPYQRQADMLLDAIKNSGEESDDAMGQMVELYKMQDIEALVSSMDEDDNIKDFEDILNHNRNQNWIPIMTQKMKEKKCFFAVGAGHLAGDAGVINLLREAGFKVVAYK